MKYITSLPKCFLGILLATFTCIYANPTSNDPCMLESHPITDLPKVNVVVLGLGGRAHELLLNCLKLKNEVNKEIRVVAVSDDYAQDSIDFFVKQLALLHPDLVNNYKKIFENATYYSSNNKSLEKIFTKHKNIDQVFITSPNYDHLRHLQAILKYSPCKRIYMEKPLFRNLEEFEKIATISDSTTIDIGLTLRYSNMARIVSEKLGLFRNQLGPLKKIHSWEHVRFGHGLSAFMMSWRRYASLSGGFLLEKSIHDIDLAFFFMKSLGLSPNRLSLYTKAEHSVFKQSNKQKILQEILNNRSLRESIERWDNKPWQRLLNFEYSSDGHILWEQTLDSFFKDFPEDDCFDESDLIPDNYKVLALVETETGENVQFELEVKVDNFSTSTKRGAHFDCEFGSVHVDIMKSEMSIELIDGTSHLFDLCSDHTDHAGGDVFIAQSIFDSLMPGQHKATYYDPIVQLSMMTGLIAEYQAKNNLDQAMIIENINGKWIRR